MREHQAVCERVIAREHGQCLLCGRPGAHIHHIIPRSDPGWWTWLEQNLALVCAWHDNPMLHTPHGKSVCLAKLIEGEHGYDYSIEPWRQYV